MNGSQTADDTDALFMSLGHGDPNFSVAIY